MKEKRTTFMGRAQKGRDYYLAFHTERYNRTIFNIKYILIYIIKVFGKINGRFILIIKLHPNTRVKEV